MVKYDFHVCHAAPIGSLTRAAAARSVVPPLIGSFTREAAAVTHRCRPVNHDDIMSPFCYYRQKHSDDAAAGNIGHATTIEEDVINADDFRRATMKWRRIKSMLTSTRFRTKLLEAVKILAAGTVLIVVIAVLTGRISYNWHWHRVPKYILVQSETGFTPGLLLEGLGVTLALSGISLVLTFAIGLITALLRLSSSIGANIISRVYLELVRNTPLLIQIFFIYFVVSPILGMSRFASAVIALSLFEGAYASEIIRGSILAIRRGQWESAYSLGLGTVDTYRYIILPQAIRIIIPPLTSQGVSLIKDSALVSTIAIFDLTMRGSAIVAETFLTFEIWFTVAAIYLIITGVLSSIARAFEKRAKVAV